MHETRYESRSERQTADIAADLARRLPAGAVVQLFGGLGAGKTAFVRGFVEGAGLDPDEVSSPTFTLVQAYGGGRVQHVDLYRLDPEETDDLGLEELPEAGALVCIEWPTGCRVRRRGPSRSASTTGAATPGNSSSRCRTSSRPRRSGPTRPGQGRRDRPPADGARRRTAVYSER